MSQCPLSETPNQNSGLRRQAAVDDISEIWPSLRSAPVCRQQFGRQMRIAVWETAVLVDEHETAPEALAALQMAAGAVKIALLTTSANRIHRSRWFF
jgi:hypothetical protein